MRKVVFVKLFKKYLGKFFLVLRIFRGKVEGEAGESERFSSFSCVLGIVRVFGRFYLVFLVGFWGWYIYMFFLDEEIGLDGLEDLFKLYYY